MNVCVCEMDVSDILKLARGRVQVRPTPSLE